MNVKSAVTAALERWGGILVRPRTTLEALGPEEGRYDWWALALLFVLGSQIEHLAETVAQFTVFRSFWLLLNGFALALLTPLFVGLVVEGIVGTPRARYRHLPLVALVVVATFGHLLRQHGFVLPGPRYLPEMLGMAWSAGLAVWIRTKMPPLPTSEVDAGAGEMLDTRDPSPGVTRD